MYADPNPRDANKGQAMLDAALENGRLTKDGYDWLVRALDPFHDTPHRPGGFPDLTSEGTVVQEVKRSVSISKPSAITGNWDLHIFSMPDLFSDANAQAAGIEDSLLMGAAQFLLRGDNGLSTDILTVKTASNTNGSYMIPLSGLCYVAVPAGSPTVPTYTVPLGTAGAANTFAYGSVDVSQYVSGKGRKIGAGFEVVNTTATIQKQGLITVYRLPQERQEGMFKFLNTEASSDAIAVPFPCIQGALPPANSSDALLLPGSKQWAAELGAYCVETMASSTNPLKAVDCRARVYMDSPGTYASGGQPQVLACYSPSSYYTATLENGDSVRAQDSPFHTSGCYLTGLSADTTIQLNYILLYEAVPGQKSPLVTLAQPSPALDSTALELYSKLVRELPPGVPRSMNDDGSWFENLMSGVSKAAPIVGAALGQPVVGSLLGTAAGLVAKGKKKKNTQTVAGTTAKAHSVLVPKARPRK